MTIVKPGRRQWWMACAGIASLGMVGVGCGTASPLDDLPRPDAGNDSAPPDSETSDSETQATPPPLMPHQVNNWWMFRYTHLPDADFGACAAGRFNSGILDMTVIDGVETYTYLSACNKDGAQAEALLQFDGDLSVVVNYGEPFVMTDIPVADGHTWTVDFSSGPKTYRWDYLGAVTVPAGTFADCYDRVDEANDDHLVYCRGIGRVMGRTRNEYLSELVDYDVQEEP